MSLKTKNSTKKNKSPIPYPFPNQKKPKKPFNKEIFSVKSKNLINTDKINT